MDERQNLIKNYVSKHQPCTMEQIVDGLHDKISRNPLYETVDVMFGKGILVDNKKNRRDHRIFVNNENLLVTIPPQIELFRKAFLDLVKSTSKATRELFRENGFSEPYPKELTGYENQMMIWQPLDILFYTMDMLTLTSTIVWPIKLKNREIMKELYAIIFSNISDIQLELFDILNPEHDYSILDFSYFSGGSRAIGSPLVLIKYSLKNYSFINLGDKMELVADILWSLSYDLRQYYEDLLEMPEKIPEAKAEWRKEISLLVLDASRRGIITPPFSKKRTK